MILTFGTQKGGTGKTTLAIAFANYLVIHEGKTVNAFDFDYQKSFYTKWKEDDALELSPLYNVELVSDTAPFQDMEFINEMKESEEIFLFDLAGTLDAEYSDLLMYSNHIIVPFEYSDVSVKSTLVFINFLGMLESEANRIFVRSKYDKGFNYLNQEGMDEELKKYGTLISHPVYKRNCLQIINTRKLAYNQKYAVQNTFDEIITQIQLK